MTSHHNRRDLLSVRRALRSDGTPSEAVLWNCLKGSKLNGRKFRRQHSIEGMVLDFYCPAERLCIEVDGAAHFDPTSSQNDQLRDIRLLKIGIRTLRFENAEILANLDGVLDVIQKYFR